MKPGVVVAFGFVAVSAARLAMAAPCPPAARVTGDAAAGVRAPLARLGVTAPRAGCPHVTAKVSREERALRVEVDGASRLVSTPEVAAALIDTYARRDVEGDLLVVDEPPPATASGDRMWFRARGETAVAGDSSAWQSVALGACARLGRFCLGVSGRWAFNPDHADENAYVRANRQSGALMGMVAAPLRAGPVTFAPEVGIGAGRFVTTRREPVEPSWIDAPNGVADEDYLLLCETDPVACQESMPYYVGDGFAVTHVTWRIEAGLSIALDLTENLSLEVNGSVESAPGAHGDPFAPKLDPASSTPVEVVALPGEPDFFFRAGLGLRWSP